MDREDGHLHEVNRGGCRARAPGVQGRTCGGSTCRLARCRRSRAVERQALARQEPREVRGQPQAQARRRRRIHGIAEKPSEGSAGAARGGAGPGEA